METTYLLNEAVCAQEMLGYVFSGFIIYIDSQIIELSPIETGHQRRCIEDVSNSSCSQTVQILRCAYGAYAVQ